MHELSIATEVLQAVRRECLRTPGAIPRRIGLRIGELSAIDPESLRFCFEALLKGTAFESLQLEIELCPRRHRCLDCHAEFKVENYSFACPTCAGTESECIGGDELALAYLEVDDHEPTAAGR